jgi:hypothetical protein
MIGSKKELYACHRHVFRNTCLNILKSRDTQTATLALTMAFFKPKMNSCSDF